MKAQLVTDDGRVVLEEECGCAASNGFFKTCERHDDIKTLSEMKAYLGLRKNLLKAAAEAQERFNQGSPERYNKRARLREMKKTQQEAPKTSEVPTENQIRKTGKIKPHRRRGRRQGSRSKR